MTVVVRVLCAPAASISCHAEATVTAGDGDSGQVRSASRAHCPTCRMCGAAQTAPTALAGRATVCVDSCWPSHGIVSATRARELVSSSFVPLLRTALPCALSSSSSPLSLACDAGGGGGATLAADFGGEWFWHGYQHALYGEDVLFDLRGSGEVLAGDDVYAQQQLRTTRASQTARAATATTTATRAPAWALGDALCGACNDALHACAPGTAKLEVMYAIALSLVLHVAQQPLLDDGCGPHALVLCATRSQCDEWTALLTRFAVALHLVVHNLFDERPAMPAHKRAEMVVGTPVLWLAAASTSVLHTWQHDAATTTTTTTQATATTTAATATATATTAVAAPATRHALYTQRHVAQLVLFDVETQLAMGFAPLLARVMGAPATLSCTSGVTCDRTRRKHDDDNNNNTACMHSARQCTASTTDNASATTAAAAATTMHVVAADACVDAECVAMPVDCQLYLVLGGAGVTDSAACACCDDVDEGNMDSDDVAYDDDESDDNNNNNNTCNTVGTVRDRRHDNEAVDDGECCRCCRLGHHHHHQQQRQEQQQSRRAPAARSAAHSRTTAASDAADRDDDDDDKNDSTATSAQDIHVAPTCDEVADARCTRCVLAWALARSRRCGAKRATVRLACAAAASPAAATATATAAATTAAAAAATRKRHRDERHGSRPLPCQHDVCGVVLRRALSHSRLCLDMSAFGELARGVVRRAQAFYDTFDAAPVPAPVAVDDGNGRTHDDNNNDDDDDDDDVGDDGDTVPASSVCLGEASAVRRGEDACRRPAASPAFCAEVVYVCTTHVCRARTMTTTVPVAAAAAAHATDARVREVCVLLTPTQATRRAFPTRVALLCSHLADELTGELFDGNVMECVPLCACAMTRLVCAHEHSDTPASPLVSPSSLLLRPVHTTHVLLASSFARAPALLRRLLRLHDAPHTRSDAARACEEVSTATTTTTMTMTEVTAVTRVSSSSAAAASTARVCAAWSPAFVRLCVPRRCPVMGHAALCAQLRRARRAAAAALARTRHTTTRVLSARPHGTTNASSMVVVLVLHTRKPRTPLHMSPQCVLLARADAPARHRDDSDDGNALLPTRAATTVATAANAAAATTTTTTSLLLAQPCPRHAFTVVALRNVAASRDALCRRRYRVAVKATTTASAAALAVAADTHGVTDWAAVLQHARAHTLGDDRWSLAMLYLDECAQYGRIVSYYCHEPSHVDGRCRDDDDDDGDRRTADVGGSHAGDCRPLTTTRASLFVEFAHYASACEAIRQLRMRAEQHAQSVLTHLTTAMRDDDDDDDDECSCSDDDTAASSADRRCRGRQSSRVTYATVQALRAAVMVQSVAHAGIRLLRNTTYYGGIAQEMQRLQRQQQQCEHATGDEDGDSRGGGRASAATLDSEDELDDMADVALLDE